MAFSRESMKTTHQTMIRRMTRKLNNLQKNSFTTRTKKRREMTQRVRQVQMLVLEKSKTKMNLVLTIRIDSKTKRRLNQETMSAPTLRNS
jgi:hypothetical protein